MQPDPTNMKCGRINPSKVKATLLSKQSPWSRTPPSPPSVAMAWQPMRLPRAGDVQEPCKRLNHRGIDATRKNQHGMWPNQSLKSQGNAPIECRQRQQQQLTPLYRQAAAAHHGTQRIAQLSEEANHQVVKAYSPVAATTPPWIPC